MVLVISDSQNSTVDFRMKCFDSAAQDLGETSQVRNISHREPGFSEGFGCSTGRYQLYRMRAEPPRKIHKARFIGDADQSPPDFLRTHSLPATKENDGQHRYSDMNCPPPTSIKPRVKSHHFCNRVLMKPSECAERKSLCLPHSTEITIPH